MKKFFASVIAIALVVAMMPLSAFATDIDVSKSGCDYYNLIEKNDYALAPGATESEIIINDNTGSNRNVVHVIEVDLKNPNISVMPTYMGLKEGIDFEDRNNWGSQVLSAQAAHVENDLGLNVVGGINTNLRYDSDHPYGVLVWNGVVYSDERNSSGVSTAQTYLVVDKEGNAELRSANEPLDGTEWQAVSANFSWIIKDGVNQYTTDDHADANRAPRTVIGIKDDGALVLMMNDGRQSPFSVGTTMRELAEIMLSMGCVDAVNCDGGGSSTFLSEREGTGELTMKSSPSDGGERATLGGLLVVSSAAADGKFHHASIAIENKYVTPGSTVEFVATGADASGGPIDGDIPEDVIWQLEDSSYGTISDGVFVSNGKTGEVVAQMVYNGEVVGKASVNVVVPEAIAFSQENITVPYGKVVNVEVKATINNGLNEVAIKDGDVVLTLSDDKLGSVENLVYSACDENVGVSSGTITATLALNTSITAVANLNLGKGSEIFWDFEDGDISSLSFASGYQSKHPAHPELGRFESGYLEVVDSTTGKVKNGDKALAVVCDWSNFYAMGYNMLRLSGLNVDLTDALRVGFWVYLTPEATGVELDFENWYEFNHGDAGSDKYPEDGWYYVSVDATKISKSTFNNLNIYHTDGYTSATNQNIPNIKTKHTIFIDDITVDYSTAVEDREAPTFTSVSVLKDADTYEAMAGQIITKSNVTVMAEAKENTDKNNYTGLNMSSAKVYVDGLELKSGVSCSSNGSISVDNLQLGDGIHTFTFEVADNAGNVRTVTRQLVVDTTEAVPELAFVPADPTLDKLPIGSLYYMNLEAANIENISKVSTVIDLDGMNDWQLEHMEVAEGFTAEYTVDEFTNNATLTVTKTGDTDVTGNGVLVSIPIRVWEYTLHIDHPDCINDGKGVCNFISTPDKMWAGDGQFRIAVMVSVAYGEVEFVDGAKDSFSSEKYVIDTEMDKHRNIITQAEKDTKTSWHIHTPVAVEDKAPTCTEDGYTGRTVCAGCSCGNTADNPCDSFDGCGSVVEWGTIVPATGHTYELTDGVLKCTCGELFNGTHTDGKLYADGVAVEGWVENSYYQDGVKLTGINLVDGYYYDFGEDGVCANKVKYTGVFKDGDVYRFSYIGEIATGWRLIGEDWYHFDSATKAASVGECTIGGITYVFEETGKLTKGVWVNDGVGSKYYYGPSSYALGWKTIEGKDYYFENGYCYKGYRYVLEASERIAQWYHFDENGALIEKMTMTGMLELESGLYYLENGMSKTGLVFVDGYYYYFRASTKKAVVNQTYTITNTNGLDIEAGTYTFDENGRMVILNGLVDEDGNTYYYENGKRTYAGLIKIDGNYYYVRSNCQVVKSATYYVQKTNDLLPVGNYTFDETGKMVRKNGLVKENGGIYYYEDGVKTYAGLIQIDGDYYYVRSNCQVVTSVTYYVQKTNGLLPVANYTFGADGKMVIKNGLVEENGGIYYYEDGVKTYAGLIQIDGDYYYVRSNCQVVTSATYYVQKTNDLLPVANYTFGADGKMVIKNGLVEENGGIYYYENGVKTYAGLIEIDGAYYYVRSNCQAVTSATYYVQKTNDLLPVANYTFGADGKMVIKNGLVEENGGIYYYEKGVKTYAGLIEIDGAYYYVRSNCQVVTSKTYYVQKTNGLLPVANYTFGADGKMITG